MKKVLVDGGIALAVLLLGALVFTQFFLDHAVTAAVKKFGPSMTQTKLQLLCDGKPNLNLSQACAVRQNTDG